uniref:Uncharacterized protein n=1 Tax=Sordaria araneosa TaxID=573841 RepID=A0A1B4XBG7_SORAA|nr:hypothetical protein [Sordaria araneosa]
MAQTIAARYQRPAYGLLAALYILLLVAPWILTCYQARKPFLLTAISTRPNYDINVHGISQADAGIATRSTYALETLNYIATLVALPAVYEILARAAVVHALRTRKTKRLNADQLFALADRKFIQGLFQSSTRRRFSFFAFSLIVLTVAHVIVRSVAVGSTWNQYMLARTTQLRTSSGGATGLAGMYTPYSWDVEAIGLSPTPEAIASVPVLNVLPRLKHDIIGTHPGEWQEKAWFSPDEDKYFVSTVKKGTTTGLVRNLALRMDSESSCRKPYRDTDYPKDCPGGEQYPFRHPNLKLNVCVQGNGTMLDNGQPVGPWRNTTDRQRIVEKIFIQFIDDKYVDEDSNRTVWLSEDWDWKGDIECQVKTELAYFELGNDHNNKTFSGKIDKLDAPDAELVAMSWKYSRHVDSPYDYYGSPVMDAVHDDVGVAVPGPLTLVSRILFGTGSFYDFAERISIDNPDRQIYSDFLSRSCPYPFQRHPLAQYQCSERKDWDGGDRQWGAAGVVKLLNLFNPASHVADPNPGPGRELLDTALALANQAVVDLSVRPTTSKTRKFGAIFSAEGVAVRQLVMSDATMAGISVLLGLQVLGILGFLAYTYRLPTWTPTLDVLAVVRIAQQLKDGHLLRAIGLRTVTKEEMKKLSEIDALIGLHEPIPLQAMRSTAVATLADLDSPGRGSGLSSATTADARSQHSQARVVPVVSDDIQMGMSSIPVDVQTVVSEDLGNVNSPSQTRRPGGALSPPPLESSAPRLSPNVADTVPEHDTDNHPGRPSSPPAYTPRTAEEPPLNPMPPSYASALAISELRVGGQGLVTRKNIPQTRDDLWV